MNISLLVYDYIFLFEAGFSKLMWIKIAAFLKISQDDKKKINSNKLEQIKSNFPITDLENWLIHFSSGKYCSKRFFLNIFPMGGF